MPEARFDAVIVGSGFGGSVMAFRLAEAGLRVCLLERGQSYPPNSFPRSPHKVARNFWDPSEGLYGLFDVWSFKGYGALVSSGLGGGSLIYANVLIRKDEKWFVTEEASEDGYRSWPVTRADLEPHYDRAEEMLNAQRYPFDHPPYTGTPKTRAMQEAADRLGLEWQLPKLAVTFANAGRDPMPGQPIEGEENLHGSPRYTCRLCGECDIGCNYGSKNTLDFNYLSAAGRLGAELRTLCEVRSFEPADPGYRVHYVRHDLSREGARFDTGTLPVETVECRVLVVAAGAFGSPFLLFRNRAAFPRLTRSLGTRVSVNGDLLSFLSKSRITKEGRTTNRVLDPSFGPVITSAIRVGDSLDGGPSQGRGFYIEDGGHPALISWLLDTGTSLPGLLERSLRFGLRVLKGLAGLTEDPDLSAELSDLIGPSESMSSLPILAMGRDLPSGRMRLAGKYLESDWSIEASREYYDRLIGTVRRLASALESEFVENLPYHWFRQILTAHPLGGCPMGTTEDEGMVDAFGEAYHYPGLFVADGSVMPGPVGPNPSLTIAALADRFAERAIERCREGN